ncbi:MULTISPECIES: ABC transporter permease [unclassified Rhizobium]|uniref:ABC transporter permease n=1 Tax=unclassified Rhizobium TaxID=2613769 RepID=UPI00161A1722|nr:MULTISPECIES: ABC transporter permease [unclassified Rhizobium]MBB3386225.1 putative spermidine/putrescine transport system permease protein [Rhizobium sp. BK098]MBB3571912.1 putative spermidine/putrescine transport system permease protein [Rhizobium sp. BK491]MBB3617929.1 putative spermidine/putrescine transport system permease protein [Rhizobium sp. BK609]MBB3683618.1 putative spermidine/putrescine transport system permease protein [Rhizobium sp. BK612]
MSVSEFPNQVIATRRWDRISTRVSAWRIVCCLILTFLLLPVALIVLLSFSPNRFMALPLSGGSLEWWAEFWTTERWLHSLGNSAFVGLCATAIATTLGTMAAIGLKALNSRPAAVLRAICAFPIITPTVVFAVSAYVSYAPIGLANSYLGLIVTHAAISAPIVLITVSGVLEGYDENLTRAALSLGASPRQAFVKIVLPLTLPGLLAGSFFALAISLDEVVISGMLAGPQQKTLPLELFAGLRDGASPVMAVAATILVATSILFTLVLELLKRRNQ